MSSIDKETWAVIIIILLVILLPVGALMLVTSPEPYHATQGNELRSAAQNAGLKVINEENVTLNLHGATGGHRYTLGDAKGKNYTIFTQSFDSEESRNAAIKAHYAQVVGKGRPLGEMIVVGDQLIIIHPGSVDIQKTIEPELFSQKWAKQGNP